jgi:hypothetical protein
MGHPVDQSYKTPIKGDNTDNDNSGQEGHKNNGDPTSEVEPEAEKRINKIVGNSIKMLNKRKSHAKTSAITLLKDEFSTIIVKPKLLTTLGAIFFYGCSYTSFDLLAITSTLIGGESYSIVYFSLMRLAYAVGRYIGFRLINQSYDKRQMHILALLSSTTFFMVLTSSAALLPAKWGLYPTILAVIIIILAGISASSLSGLFMNSFLRFSEKRLTRSGRTFAVNRAIVFAGYILGPLLATYLNSVINKPSISIVIMNIPMVILVLIIIVIHLSCTTD